MISRLFYGQLPVWARPTHPVMRYAIGYQQISWGRMLLRVVLGLVVLALTLGVSYVYVQETSEAPSTDWREVLYFPLVGITLLMQLFAIAITTNAISLERQKGTWESLQITLVGASTSVRTRWAVVFYRLRWLLAAVFVGRLVYMALLLNDLTDFEGRAIDVRIAGISPEVSLEVAVFLIAALLTAAVLQPFVALAFDAAIGIFVSTVFQRRGIGILTTVLLIGLRIGVTVGALIFGNQVVNANGTTVDILSMSPEESWGRVLLLVTQGDLSLRILNLETLGHLWADLQEGIYIGGIVLALVVVQAMVANGLVLLAARRAGRPSKS